MCSLSQNMEIRSLGCVRGLLIALYIYTLETGILDSPNDATPSSLIYSLDCNFI